MSGDTVYISSVKLEKGPSATDWSEKYYTLSGASAQNYDIWGDTTLYAAWISNSYTLTFDANDGTVNTTSKAGQYNSAWGTLPTPTRTGYAFKGWYTSTSDDATEITADTVGMYR